MNFKKNARWILPIAVVLITVLGIGFAINQTNNIALPSAAEVTSISLTQYDNRSPAGLVTISDAAEIAGILDALSGATKTGQQSVNDYPVQDSYLLVCLSLEGKERRLCLYSDGADYAEEPYVAIYRAKHDFSTIYAIYTTHSSSESVPPSAPLATEWVDYYNSREFSWDASKDLELPEFPGVTFRWTGNNVVAFDATGDHLLFQGMPIWNVYLADLTGDGLPEFCATVSFGSGLIDTRVVVFDYANDQFYDLADRGHYDYTLLLNNGQLIVTQTQFNQYHMPGTTSSLTIIDGMLCAPGIDRTVTVYSPNSAYFIKGYGTDFTMPISGIYPVEEIRIVSTRTNQPVWHMSGLYLLYQSPQYCWSPDSRYVSIAHAGRTWVDALYVDTKDFSAHTLPGLFELSPLFPDIPPDDNRPDPQIIPQYWENEHTLVVSFSWIPKQESERFYVSYAYDVITGSFDIRMG